ncbi:MAG TPA: hypothetical protein DIU37_01135 [Opitutae bacterium]|nr:hypothetical protein [Opitutae bacterium]
MKSAYELAMEKLEADEPSQTLTTAQKDAIAEIQIRYTAKVAEREVFLQKQLDNALQSGNLTEAEAIREQLTREKARLEEEKEAEKEKIRAPRS